VLTESRHCVSAGALGVPTTQAYQYAQVLTTVLPADRVRPAPVAIRPDPIGDYLALTVLGRDRTVLADSLRVAESGPPPRNLHMWSTGMPCCSVARYQNDPATAVRSPPRP